MTKPRRPKIFFRIIQKKDCVFINYSYIYFLNLLFLQARQEIQEQAEKINKIAHDVEKTYVHFINMYNHRNSLIVAFFSHTLVCEPLYS
jgi:uncharacterized protein YecE (DUF72 family)